MIIRYSANALIGELPLPTWYVELSTAENLAEMAAAAHWREHPEDTPTPITVIHLQDVDSDDLGFFEVSCQLVPTFTACQLLQA